MRAVPSSVAAALALLASGCIYDDYDDYDDYDEQTVVVVSTGTALIDWTVNGSNARGACDAFSADSINITVLDSNGFVIGTFAQACEAFATTITLSAGNYSADALLVDSSDTPRTTTVRILPFTIFGGDRVDIPIDFPANSFY